MAKLPTRLNSTLLPLGLVALVAGCGGGSMVSRPDGSTFVPPPPGGGSTATTQTAKATLTIYVPRRRPSALRKPSYVSPGTSTVTVSVFPAGAPSPWPLPTSTTVPTPVPVASGAPPPTPVPVTMTVNAPLGNAQFYVNTYDTNGYLLSGALSSPVPISPAAPNAVNMTLNASVQEIEINAPGATTCPVPSPANLTVYPLANQANAQSGTFVVTPCDIDGYVIPAGQTLSNPLVFTNTPPVALGHARKPQGGGPPILSFSPGTISAGGDTSVTVTYAANQSSTPQMYLVPGQPVIGHTQYASITTSPVEDILVTNRGDSTVSVFTDLSGGITAAGTFPTGATSGPTHIVGASSMKGCAQGGQAAITDDGSPGQISILNLPLSPINLAPSPQPVITNIGGVSGNVTAEGIVGCNVYIGAGGYLSSLAMASQLLGAPNGPYSNPANGQTAFTYGNAPISAVGGLGSSVYLGLGMTGGYLNNMVNIANAPFGSAAVSVDAIAPFDSGHVALAYHSGGYLYFGLFDGNTITQPWQAPANITVAAMTADSSPYNVYAISAAGNNYIFQYTPGTATGSQSSLGGLYPSGIAFEPGGQILVTDTNGGSGNGTLYVYPNYASPTMPTPNSTPAVGSNPSGVAVVPN